MINLFTILGPTASGKTSLAAQVAYAMGAEIISADSRQVFKGMNIGTGKDLQEFNVENQQIPVHMVDVAEPGTEFSVYDYVSGFKKAFTRIKANGNTAVLCGGTGLYIEAVLKEYELIEVPVNHSLRNEWSAQDDSVLIGMLKELKPLHNSTDTLSRERLERALEIELYKIKPAPSVKEFDFSDTPVFGLRYDRLEERARITCRLKARLDSGMVEEVKQLIEMGIQPQRLMQYGLEYRYVTRFLTGELKYDDMFRLLNTAIHQFAKRQMTWFRRMERTGIRIQWLRGEDGIKKNTETILQCIDKSINYYF